MTIRIDKNGRQYEHTSVYVPRDVYTEAKALNIGFSRALEDALTKKIDEARNAKQ